MILKAVSHNQQEPGVLLTLSYGSACLPRFSSFSSFYSVLFTDISGPDCDLEVSAPEVL